MNKTIIALAITAALPVAAQADATISGSVSVKYVSGAVTNTEALAITSTEVLANGMTATASMNVLTGASGKASLAGDFGTITAGSIDDDAAFQAGDVAGVVGDSSGTTTTNTSTTGLHYAGTVADLAFQVQRNATTTQASATYDFNGLTIGAGWADGAATTASAAVVALAAITATDNVVGRTAVAAVAAGTTAGVTADMTVVGASYAFGDLVVKVGKSSLADRAVGTATYTTTLDAITLTASASSATTATASAASSLSAAYTLDGITLTAKSAKAATGVNSSSLTASYVSGDLTVTANNNSAFSAALDLGNADLTLARSASNATTAPSTTSVTYKVAF